jgi:adenylate kinase
MVRDEVVTRMVGKEMEAIQKEKKSFILSGYPRTRVQGLAMQREGVFPDAFIILNMPFQKVLQHCEDKFKTYEKNLDKAITANRNVHIENHAREYLLNVQQIKDIYPNNYFEIDCSTSSREDILEDIARLLRFKIKSKRPKRPASILILGGKKEQRGNIAKKLAKRYGFVLAMAREQLSDQISRNTEVGRLVLDNIRRKTLVKDSIMNGLIQSRLSQVDAQMQGFVLEGFPRTEGQAVSLKDVYIQPTLIAVL